MAVAVPLSLTAQDPLEETEIQAPKGSSEPPNLQETKTPDREEPVVVDEPEPPADLNEVRAQQVTPRSSTPPPPGSLDKTVLTEHYLKLAMQLAEMKTKYGRKHPKLIAAREQLNALTELIAQADRNAHAQTETSAAAELATLRALKSQLLIQLAELKLAYTEESAMVKSKEQQLAKVSQQIETLRIANNTDSENQSSAPANPDLIAAWEQMVQHRKQAVSMEEATHAEGISTSDSLFEAEKKWLDARVGPGQGQGGHSRFTSNPGGEYRRSQKVT